MIRPICKNCNRLPCAINYKKNEKTHYRSICDKCGKEKKASKKKPLKHTWQKKGYKKKSNCYLCGFQAKLSAQITVYHIDGNLNNADLSNLRSICLNCVEVVKVTQINWKRGDLVVDY